MRHNFLIITLLFLIFGCSVRDSHYTEIVGNGEIVEGEVYLSSIEKLYIELENFYPNGLNKQPSIEVIPSDENKIIITTDSNILKEIRVNDDYGRVFLESGVYKENRFNKLNIKVYTTELHTIKCYLTETTIDMSKIPQELKGLTLGLGDGVDVILPKKLTLTGTLIFNKGRYYDPYQYDDNFKSKVSGIEVLKCKYFQNPDDKLIEFTSLESLECDGSFRLDYLVFPEYISISAREIFNIIHPPSYINSIKLEKLYATDSIKLVSSNYIVNFVEAPLISINTSENITLNNLKGDDLTISSIDCDLYIHNLTNFKTANISLNSSNIDISGLSTNLNIELKNSSNTETLFNGENLFSSNATVVQENLTTATLNVSDFLDYDLRGSSILKVKGSPVISPNSVKENFSTLIQEEI